MSAQPTGDINQDQPRGDAGQDQPGGKVRQDQPRGDARQDQSRGDPRQDQSRGDPRQEQPRGDARREAASPDAGWARAGGPTPPGAGHRALPHPADLVVEAWAPTLPACLAQAVLGLVDTFADGAGVPASGRHQFALPAAPADEQLVALLNEVIFVVDVADAVPVAARVSPDGDGGFAVELATAPVEAVPVVGPAPKAVALSGLRAEQTGTGWVCRALVDV